MVTTAKHLLAGLLVSVTLAAPESGRTVRDEAVQSRDHARHGFLLRRVLPRGGAGRYYSTIPSSPGPASGDGGSDLLIRCTIPRGAAAFEKGWGQMVYFSIDCEASGQVPPQYNLLSIGATVVRRENDHLVIGDAFYAELKPIYDTRQPLRSFTNHI